MSSSAETPLDWSTFRERPVSDPVELLSPAAELAAALQRARRDVDAERHRREQDANHANTVAAEHAVLVFHLSAVLARHDTDLADAGLDVVRRTLRVLRDQMLAVFERDGLTVVDPLGLPYDEVADDVEVSGWRHGTDYPGDVVAETVEPIVRRAAEVIRPGRVVMGAPDPAATSEGTA